MRCISPILIRSKGRHDFVPCGKCNFCLQTKRFDWSFRLLQEIKVSSSAYFLTLTYNEDNHPLDGSLSRRDFQLFMKKLRKRNSVPLRYYTVGEYGTRTLRPHYHSIMFNLDQSLAVRLSEVWEKGTCFVGDVQPASVNYVTKYVINAALDYGGREPPFSLMSRRPGIGASYLATHREWHRADFRNYTQVNGKLGRLPRYYKNAFFSDSEKRYIAKKAMAASDAAYEKTLLRLAKFHPDPSLYYDVCVEKAHEAVTREVNYSNQF